ncbi:hypothetical protein FNU76_10200 [Chitinimonas arctica]|uniref:DUF3168 domain-containing protein n=1 Tax=Chitinimonas arctica TaxID=2594795 RepID=A0A516SEX2_9NEIS|nr:hypothetical protein [Chitinimonas arctica]QDQ26705.1 hypothetical protein FNU76_10200 [Chitinimonas arctica]
MSTHARTQIRAAAKQALAGLPSIGSRVFSNRARPVDPDKLGGPCLLVYCNDEPQIEAAEIGTPHVQLRRLDLVLRVVCKAGTDVDDVLDACLLQIEQAMAADTSLGGVIPAGVQLASIQTDVDDSLETPLGVAVLLYRAEYQTFNTAPDVLL